MTKSNIKTSTNRVAEPRKNNAAFHPECCKAGSRASFEQWRELLLHNPAPSTKLQAAMSLGLLNELYPQLLPLARTMQDKKRHPEGDVWMHTLMAIDVAVDEAARDKLSLEDKLTLTLAALCHDFGKPATTTAKNGHNVFPGHEHAAVAPARAFLDTIGVPSEITQRVLILIETHMQPGKLHRSALAGQPITAATIRGLEAQIYPVTIDQLIRLNEADYFGRGAFPDSESEYKIIGNPPSKWMRARIAAIRAETPKSLILLPSRA